MKRQSESVYGRDVAIAEARQGSDTKVAKENRCKFQSLSVGRYVGDAKCLGPKQID